MKFSTMNHAKVKINHIQDKMNHFEAMIQDLKRDQDKLRQSFELLAAQLTNSNAEIVTKRMSHLLLL
eukprot:800239-Ditylum_brightwellii.AAC.1